MKKQPPPNPQDLDQVVMDLEDARARLDAMHQAITRRDEAEAEVRRLTMALAQAKRRLKEAGWNLALLLGSERRKS